MEKLKLNFVVNYWSIMYIDFESYIERLRKQTNLTLTVRNAFSLRHATIYL